MPRRTSRLTVLAAPAALLALGLSACGKDDEGVIGGSGRDRGATSTATSTAASAPSATQAATSTADEPGATANGCRAVDRPAPKAEQDRARPTLELDRKRTYTAALETNCGRIVIRLDVKDFPKTTASFVSLARADFYDELTFHRVSRPGGTPFVIQGGDPLGTGNGDPGYSVTEDPPSDTRYTRGVVAMAKTEIEDPGTSGSQFFIVVARKVDLPPDYAVLGNVVRGSKAVQRIANVPTDPTTEVPSDPVVIDSITISPAED